MNYKIGKRKTINDMNRKFTKIPVISGETGESTSLEIKIYKCKLDI